MKVLKVVADFISALIYEAREEFGYNPEKDKLRRKRKESHDFIDSIIWWKQLSDSVKIEIIKRFSLTVGDRDLNTVSNNDIYLMWLGRNRNDF